MPRGNARHYPRRRRQALLHDAASAAGVPARLSEPTAAAAPPSMCACSHPCRHHAVADPLRAASRGRPRAAPRGQPFAAAGRGENEKHARAEQVLQQRTAKALDASLAVITRLIGVGDMYGGVGSSQPALPPGEEAAAAALGGDAKRVSFRSRAKTKRQVAQARGIAAAASPRAARACAAAAARAEGMLRVRRRLLLSACSATTCRFPRRNTACWTPAGCRVWTTALFASRCPWALSLLS